MLHGKSITRWLFVVAAAFQVVLPTAATLADGWLDRSDAQPGIRTSHIEAHGSPSCARIHSDGCALCRVANAIASPARAIELPLCIARLGSPAADGTLGGGASIDHGLPASRAPPRSDELVENAA